MRQRLKGLMAPRIQIDKVECGMLPMSFEKSELIDIKIRHGGKPFSY